MGCESQDCGGVVSKYEKQEEAARQLKRILDSYGPEDSMATLSPALVSECVDWIEELRDDDSSAHTYEDRLHQAVLRAVQQAHPDSVALAGEALRTKTIDFSRWTE